MGVARDATEAQIKQAYRKLARKYHPDVSKEKMRRPGSRNWANPTNTEESGEARGVRPIG